MKKLIVNSQEHLRFVPHHEITYCKSDNCYTSIFLNNGEELVVCKSLTKVLLDLNPDDFIRISQSYLINKDYIKLIDKKNKQVELIDSKRIPFTTTINKLLILISKQTAVIALLLLDQGILKF